jgi:4-hydroxybenzoate polyprenyltransferase
VKRWWIFVRERFPLQSAVPMTLTFAGANAAIAGGSDLLLVPRVRLLAIALLAVSFFFRLRLADELKDRETDRVVHPQRPLARGLLRAREVRRVACSLAALEMAVAAALGPGVLVAHGIAVGYSFVMGREFFAGTWLRPRLTLYAVVHTLVSAPLGWSIACATLGGGLADLPAPLLAFGGVNWMLFNTFEFARKTFAPLEERDGVPSYSKVFGIGGAGILTTSQIVVALGILAVIGPELAAGALVAAPAALAALPLAAVLAYAARREPPRQGSCGPWPERTSCCSSDPSRW